MLKPAELWVRLPCGWILNQNLERQVTAVASAKAALESDTRLLALLRGQSLNCKAIQLILLQPRRLRRRATVGRMRTLVRATEIFLLDV